VIIPLVYRTVLVLASVRVPRPLFGAVPSIKKLPCSEVSAPAGDVAVPVVVVVVPVVVVVVVPAVRE
jgi:hypothetical protein